MNKFLQSNNNNIATYHWNITFKRPFEEDGANHLTERPRTTTTQPIYDPWHLSPKFDASMPDALGAIEVSTTIDSPWPPRDLRNAKVENISSAGHTLAQRLDQQHRT